MAKKVFYDDDARERVLGGAKALYDAVKVTYGPKGRNVVIAKGYGGPTVTHDGVTVAEAVDLPENDDETLGFYSCVLVVAQGEDDVKRFRFFDADTKCIFQVRGGPSNVDNDLIGKCAKTAYALIGPDQIKPGAPAATAPAEGSAAGSGSAN